MPKQALPTTLLVVLAALCMGVSSALLFYTDDRLNQYGIGSPFGVGDSVTGTCALWLQPWLLVAARVGMFQSWALSLSTFLVIGFFSGGILAALAGLLVHRWTRCFWPFMVIFVVLALASTAYAVRNFRLIEEARSWDHPG